MLFNKTKQLSNFLFNSLNKSISYNITVRKYTPQHEWIDLDYDEKVGRIGITNLGLKIIGEIAHAEMKHVGQYLSKNDAVAKVVGRHYVAELVTPVSTEIIGYNKTWRDMPSFVTLDVENENNWFVEINLSDVNQFNVIENLLSLETYNKRYSEFIGDKGIPRLLDEVQLPYQ